MNIQGKRRRRAQRPRFKCAAGCGAAVWRRDTYCGRPTCRQLRLGAEPEPELDAPAPFAGGYDPATAPFPEGY